MKIKWLLIASLLCFVNQTAIGQTEFVVKSFATGLNKPVDIAHSTNDSLYIVERDGTIRIVDPDGSLGNIFLDISGRVNSGANERGLLGLAFHPEFPDSAYIYVNYTGDDGDTYISRFDVLTPAQADPDSEKIIMNVSQPFANHNAGDLIFGPDSYLYIALGDGGSGGDPGNRAQSLDELLGKILRIDVDNGDPYSIPPGNPFTSDEDAFDEIWIYGVRNPWRMTYDDISGGLYFGDVGQNSWEEINFVPASGHDDPNYGWRCYEGNHAYDMSECDGVENVVFPIYEYPHLAQNCSGSVTGGVVYRGDDIPQLYGKYIFADYCTGMMAAINVDNAYEVDFLPDFADFQISSFGTDNSGEMYLAALGEGAIYKFCPVAPYNIFSVTLNGAQANTPSPGMGNGVGIYVAASSQLCVSGNYSNLTGNPTSGHIHEGDVGISGDVVFDMDITPESGSGGAYYGCEALSYDQLTRLMGNGMYVDIHTSAYAEGEIRGQLILEICPDQYSLTVPFIPPGEYKAQQIIANGLVESSNSLTLKYENSVLLNEGFQVDANGILEIWMENCGED